MTVAEMRIFCWMCGVTKKDKIRNESIKRSVKVVDISMKIFF